MTEKALDLDPPNLDAVTGMARVNQYAVTQTLSNAKNVQIIARAAASGSYKAMQLLLSLRAPLDVKDKKRLTSLARKSIQIYAPQRLGFGLRPELPQLEASTFGDQRPLDLEETVEHLMESKPSLFRNLGELTEEDILVQERYPKQKTATLILDTSGSMYGGRLSIAATACALIAHHLSNDNLAIVTYSQYPTVLQRLNDIPSPARTANIISKLLTVQPIGHTNLEAALQRGYKELLRTPPNTPREDRWALLLTDGVYTLGKNPSYVARKFPHLHILATPISTQAVASPGQGIAFLKKLAQLGHGKYAELPPDHPETLPAILTKLLSRMSSP